MRIVHIGSAGTIMTPFVEFVNLNLSSSDHLFLLDTNSDHSVPEINNVIQCGRQSRWKNYWVKFFAVYRAEKVILHGLFDARMIILLAFQPWLLKKIHWAIWGGDLYTYQFGPKTTKWKIAEFFKKAIIPRIGYFITHIKGDYELAKQWYGAKGQWHECFMYPSNLYRDYPVRSRSHEGTNILLGNSATPTNNHLDAMEKLRPFADENIRIYCPLSYGDMVYGAQVALAGKDMFGDKFVPLHELMPFDKYLDLLSEIDIAVFNHNRQQGMGNVTTLLGIGKKVYMNPETTSYETLCRIGLCVFDVNSLDLCDMDEPVRNENIKKTSDYFSPKNLIGQWSSIFLSYDTEI